MWTKRGADKQKSKTSGRKELIIPSSLEFISEELYPWTESYAQFLKKIAKTYPV